MGMLHWKKQRKERETPQSCPSGSVPNALEIKEKNQKNKVTNISGNPTPSISAASSIPYGTTVLSLSSCTYVRSSVRTRLDGGQHNIKERLLN